MISTPPPLIDAIMMLQKVANGGCDIRIFSYWPLGQWSFEIHWPDLIFTGPDKLYHTHIFNAKMSIGLFFRQCSQVRLETMYSPGAQPQKSLQPAPLYSCAYPVL